MKITKADFAISLGKNQNFPGCGLPQIVIMGKSNVGKSSLINSLANQKKLARTSQQPGQTRLINIYLFNEQFHLVDLPGYGYAKTSNREQRGWVTMMNDFFENSEHQVLFLHLVDIRHEPSKLDHQMADWIRESGIQCTTVATKADKLSKSQCQRAINVISQTLGIQSNEIIPFSSVNKQGREELLKRIEQALKG